ncbi:Hypothetical predicted protein [Olea europaea subsp. europaea]|uniref:Uncharacterized protein n=1 Tax=Olea europaea subsp. europaea TaxID=158383 RepID=A0A8S0TVI9_OLEEU|nr:Hypothetical predicted protein [Olea europaea subsp. europaea]
MVQQLRAKMYWTQNWPNERVRQKNFGEKARWRRPRIKRRQSKSTSKKSRNSNSNMVDGGTNIRPPHQYSMLTPTSYLHDSMPTPLSFSLRSMPTPLSLSQHLPTTNLIRPSSTIAMYNPQGQAFSTLRLESLSAATL